ncbi:MULTISPECIES: PHP domain-containing protein [Brevibacterium]|uniref:PHP domain-containing protein n=1 Tax=Brevibacterium pityocampae TaxID=506594 RepID=A0ABP8JJ12_9MICO|nr:PHP domain-containing protein [Brevibacterium sp. CS2]QCP05433.1 PHP domain-containing protein [Brevibacterium sp. CS2]
MAIDLHTHSRFSDGTQSPTALVEEAAELGVAVLGLTDHDTTAGWDEAVRAAQAAGIALVRGMEVSCRYDGISVHLLSYLHDPAAAELTAAVADARRARLDRTRTMVERLAEDFPLSWESVLEQAGAEATIGRPHIADALVTAGIVGDRSAAFAGLLSSHSKYYVSLPTISPIEAIRMVHEAGGAAVFAHPRASLRGRTVPDAGVRAMVEAGLDGLEVDHRDNPPSARVALRATAEAHGLLVTGSSDYHGTGKPNRLAEHTTDPEMLERLVAVTSGVPLIDA